MMSQQKEIARFAFAGVLVVGTDMGLYAALIHFLPFWLSKAASFTAGGVVAYVVNKYWTFQQQRRSSAEVVRFVIANTAALGLNVAVNELVLALSAGAVLVSLAAATLAASVFTYMVFKFWVFVK